MIPLRLHRVLLLLFGVSAFLAIVDGIFLRWGMSHQTSDVLSGLVAGLMVFYIAYQGGKVLVFCGKRLVDDPERRARIRAALYDIGIIEERRKGKRRKEGRAALAAANEIERRVADRRKQVGPPPGKKLMYVSVVNSERFIAITVNSGDTHRAFVSTRMVDSLTHGALRGVLAHEYGHVVNRHPIKQATILGLVSAVKFGVGIPVGAVVVLLLAYLFMLREWEFVADAAAVKRTSPEDVLAAFYEYRLIEGDKDLSRLSEFFCGHPSFRRRIAAINESLAVSPGRGD
ncbi:M48 family metalloprotease [Sulfuricystis multivorans]|uniref:M48 family metalloprotease n=1 Tax=Sulfuricystis multivorans TaxID=2211108 RepID=UPI000F84DE7C|nr:M48 family metalloprotease [Sulfuricystis multivorans]